MRGVDIFSRKIVGWEGHECESADLAATLIRQAVMAEGCLARPLVLHADNGSPLFLTFVASEAKGSHFSGVAFVMGRGGGRTVPLLVVVDRCRVWSPPSFPMT